MLVKRGMISTLQGMGRMSGMALPNAHAITKGLGMGPVMEGIRTAAHTHTRIGMRTVVMVTDIATVHTRTGTPQTAPGISITRTPTTPVVTQLVDFRKLLQPHCRPPHTVPGLFIPVLYMMVVGLGMAALVPTVAVVTV
jgi:hypothetical protein